MRFVAAYRSLVMFIVIFERSKLVLIWSTKLRQSPLFLETKSPVRVHNPNQVHWKTGQAVSWILSEVQQVNFESVRLISIAMKAR
jgi:hypothetical protein